MNISPNGIDFIKADEALRLFAYPDPDSPLAQATLSLRHRWGFEPGPAVIASLPATTAALSGDPWTIGYGHTDDVHPSDTVDAHQADVLFEADLGPTSDVVNRCAPPDATQNQFDACMSLAYNIGDQAFERSTLARLWKAGKAALAAQQFKLWCHDNGKVVEGLVNRRAAETALFLKDDSP